MRFRTLLDRWSKRDAREMTNELFPIRLTKDDAARVQALCELFPGNSGEDIVSDLLATALDELEAAMPYVPGDNIIREDEFGDPVYEDVGLTPRFAELVRRRRAELAKD